MSIVPASLQVAMGGPLCQELFAPCLHRGPPMSRIPRSPLDYLPASESFHDPVREGADQPERARAVVIPFGLEASVSYGAGTATGPAAILAASHQLELYDEELGREACTEYGIATIRAPRIAKPLDAALTQLSRLVEQVLEEG